MHTLQIRPFFSKFSLRFYKEEQMVRSKKPFGANGTQIRGRCKRIPCFLGLRSIGLGESCVRKSLDRISGRLMKSLRCNG
jgi:hypothetical protein